MTLNEIIEEVRNGKPIPKGCYQIPLGIWGSYPVVAYPDRVITPGTMPHGFRVNLEGRES